MLTTAQMQTIKAAILADPTQANNVAIQDYSAIADWLNAKLADKGWNSAQPEANSDDAPDYSTFDSIVPGKRESWGFFLARSRDFSRNKVRKWVTDVWGNATSGSNAEAILQAATRSISRAEKLLAGNAATTGTVTAYKLGWEGDISVYEIGGILSA